MREITFRELFVFITIVWVIVRTIIGIKNHTLSVKREAQLLLVYTCIVVIARVVYFPLSLVNGHIGTLTFDPSKAFPFWFNLVPIIHMFDSYDGWLINIIGNVTMFIPVGIVWPVCFKQLDTIGKTTLAGFGFTLLIEITQLPFYERCSDIDDLIMNTTGALIGAVIYFVIKKVRTKKMS